MSKYYTPSIEEFHVGFECEFRNTANKPIVWDKKSLATNELNQLVKYCECNSTEKAGIRVKYLDKEDIESLGFIFSGKAVDDWYKKDTRLRLASGHWFNSFRLQHDRDNTFQISEDHCYNIKIYACVAGCDDETLYEGIIKNKSELKRLLKQLGINE